MKGVSLAIETIIFIILAVLVLTVLLFFFTSQAGPVQERFKLENERNQLCGKYVQNDRTCEGVGGSPIGDSDKLTDVCKQLGIKCDDGNLKCIQRCCITCPTRP